MAGPLLLFHFDPGSDDALVSGDPGGVVDDPLGGKPGRVVDAVNSGEVGFEVKPVVTDPDPIAYALPAVRAFGSTIAWMRARTPSQSCPERPSTDRSASNASRPSVSVIR